MTIGIVFVASATTRAISVTLHNDDVHIEMHEIGGKLSKPFGFPVRIAVLNDEVLPLHPTEIAQSSDE